MPSRQEYEEFFTAADIDGSGTLSFEELVKTLRGKGYRGSNAELKVSINNYVISYSIIHTYTHIYIYESRKHLSNVNSDNYNNNE